jgi:hypothetical protein
MLADYLLIANWLFIAIGAALLGGTGLALREYRRTGAFPGQPAADREGSTRVSPRTAVIKCILGALLILWGALSLLTGFGLG